MARGRIVILSGPSGVGKDTVINAWKRVNPLVQRVIAYTTRAPRDGEVDGVDYNFVSCEKFKSMAASDDFLEWKEVHGNFYATPLKDMERMLDEGKIAILKIDVQGALEAMALRPDAVSVFILPPSWDELERRISSRALDSQSVIVKRLENAKAELSMAGHYQHQCVNADLEHCVAHLESIVQEAAD